LRSRIRKSGAGRHRKEQQGGDLDKQFDHVLNTHTAGFPVKGIQWTYLSVEDIREKLAAIGLPQSRSIIYRLQGKVIWVGEKWPNE